jgi:hypothetical protein
MYTDNTGVPTWTNPLVLDSGGNLGGSNEIWIPAGLPAKFVLAPSTDTDPPSSPYWTRDNISGVNDPTGSFTEWVPSGLTPTFLSATSFTLVGDQTLIFTPGRRLKTTNTGGTVYSTILTSVFGALTTVTVVNDSSTLDAGLSAVWYGLISSENDSLPGIDISAVRFGVTADGATNDATAAQNAINYISSRKGTLRWPSGSINLSTQTLVLKNNARYIGAGISATQFTYFGTSDAIQINNPINSSTPANIYLGDFSVICSTRTSGKASIADVGSSYLDIERVSVRGNANGIIFDQTEIASIRYCQLNLGATSTDVGIWLVNGPDHTTSASVTFTNRIKIDNNQFNGVAGIGLLDDGGVAHTIANNNFNALTTHLRLAFGLGVSILGNEFENPTSTCIALQGSTLSGGLTNSTQALEIGGNYLSASTDSVGLINYGPLSVASQFIHNNLFNNTTSNGFPTVNITSVVNTFGMGNIQGGVGSFALTDLGNFLGGQNTGVPIRIGGSYTLGAVENSLWNRESPVTRYYIGDGSGFSLEFCKRTGSTTTPLFSMSDVGVYRVLTAGGYHSSDNSAGVTTTFANSSHVFTIKDGLITGMT